LAILRCTTSGTDRLRTLVQGLSWAACGVAQALLPVSNVGNASALVTGRSACATTPPIRAHAFDGHAKAAPSTRPDDEPQTQANCDYVCAPPCSLHTVATQEGFEVPRGVHDPKNFHSLQLWTVEYEQPLEARYSKHSQRRKNRVLQARMPSHVGLGGEERKCFVGSEEKVVTNSGFACVAR